MLWCYKRYAEILSWAEQSGTQFFSLSNLLLVSSSCAAIRTGFWQTVFSTKTCPQGVLQVQQEKSRCFIFTTLLCACLTENLPLNRPNQILRIFWKKEHILIHVEFFSQICSFRNANWGPKTVTMKCQKEFQNYIWIMIYTYVVPWWHLLTWPRA